MTWVHRELHSSFKLKRRSGAVSKSCEEVYLRDDISCGVLSCATCKPDTLSVAADVPHVLLPDQLTLQTYLDIFELPDFRNYVLCSSELRKVSTVASSRVKNRVRALYHDARRGVHVFDNLHHLCTARLEQGSSQSHLYAAALFYWQHLGAEIRVILLSDAMASDGPADVLSQFKGLSLQGPGVQVLSMQQYVQQHWSHNTTVVDVFDSIQQSLLRKEAAGSTQSGGRRRYPPYWPLHLINEGLESGDLLQGTLTMQRSSANDGVVQVGSGGASTGQLVQIKGKQALNRAMHGDQVVVKLLQQEVLSRSPHAGDDSVHGLPHAGQDEMEDGITGVDDSSAAELVDDDAEPELLEDVDLENQPARLTSAQVLLCGEIVGIVQRSNVELVACLSLQDEQEASEGSGRWMGPMVRVVPMDTRYPIAIVRTRHPDKLVGQRFVIRMDEWSDQDGYPDAHIIKVLGPLNDVQAESEALLVQCGVNWQPFCEGCMTELPAVSDPRQWTVNQEEWHSRRDLTGPEYYVCSIDPPGCTDVDDALHVRRLSGGKWEVGVHIADVSHFVRPGSLLDREAAARCTTVYMVDRRLDMLPSLLSEHLASLREGTPRLTVSVIWTLSSQLEVLDTWYGRAVILNRHQLEYQQAQAILDGQELNGTWWIPHNKQQLLKTNLTVLKTLADKLRNERMTRGALELESAEFQFDVGQDLQPQELLRKQKVPMMDIVAEMMIFANAAVAERIATVFPTAALLRNHAPPPKEDPFKEVAQLCEQLGVKLDFSSNKALAKTVQGVARAAGSGALLSLLKSLVTRAMSQARYFSTGAPAPGGGGYYHYGLALPYYTHFTSPIRRYADVVVHRQLLASLSPTPTQAPLQHTQLQAAANIMNERNHESKRAQQASRQLYLLALLHSQPQVEQALVCGIHERGIEVFFPPLHIRAKVFLLTKSGGVRLPAETEEQLQQQDESASHTATKLRLMSQSGQIDVVDITTGVVVYSITLWQSVWVLMAADASRSRGLLMRLRLLAPSHPRVDVTAQPLTSAAVFKMVSSAEINKTIPLGVTSLSERITHSSPLNPDTDPEPGSLSTSPKPHAPRFSSLNDAFSPSTSPNKQAGRPILPTQTGPTVSPARSRIHISKGTSSGDNGMNDQPRLSGGSLYDMLQADTTVKQQVQTDVPPGAASQPVRGQVPAPLASVLPACSCLSTTTPTEHELAGSVVPVRAGQPFSSDSEPSVADALLSELRERLARYHAQWNACSIASVRRERLGTRISELSNRLIDEQRKMHKLK